MIKSQLCFLNIEVIGELTILTTKIITLLEFINFVSEVSRLQYEWSSDCWCIWKSLGVNACLQRRNVFSFHWEVFLYSFLWIFRGYLWLHMRPGNSRTIVSLRIPSCILSRAGVRQRGTRTFKTPFVVGQRNQAKASGLFDFEREHSSKVTFSSVVTCLRYRQEEVAGSKLADNDFFSF
jgi:hypothetical protein